MSNALAIATVTQALALHLVNGLRPEIDVAVSVETRKPPTEPPTEPTITVFLYQVTPNASLRGHDLPTRASDGTLLKRPAAALDLHYLISAYGDETELVGQRLIGCVVRTLHEMPVLSRELIEEAAQLPYLAGSDLALSPQKVRFTQTQMDVDETSKLWGMLNQTPYVLSACYQASLVLVEGRGTPVEGKPVERVHADVLPSVAAAAVPRAAGGGDGSGGPGQDAKRTAAGQGTMRTPGAADGGKRADKTGRQRGSATGTAKETGAEDGPAAKRTAAAPARRRKASGTASRGGRTAAAEAPDGGASEES